MDAANKAEYLAEKVCNQIVAATSDADVRRLAAKRVAQRFGFEVTQQTCMEQAAEELGIEL